MGKPLLFDLFGCEKLVSQISLTIDGKLGKMVHRQFPDGEYYIRILSKVDNQDAILVTNLDNPNGKLLALLFAAKTLRELGARRIGLVTPYLPYLRQDMKFAPGEALTNVHFADLVRPHFDWLVTVDPHLHRIDDLSDLYGAGAKVINSAPAIVDWISANIDRPIIIGPDSESHQWGGVVAESLSAPFIVANKKRRGDRSVDVSLTDPSTDQEYTPIVIDDIISTARTMIETVKVLKGYGMRAPVCIGVHALCTDECIIDLKQAGAINVVTCNTITHPSNGIDVYDLITNSVKQILS